MLVLALMVALVVIVVLSYEGNRADSGKGISCDQGGEISTRGLDTTRITWRDGHFALTTFYPSVIEISYFGCMGLTICCCQYSELP